MARLCQIRSLGFISFFRLLPKAAGAGRGEGCVAVPKKDIQLLAALILKLWEQGKVLLTDLHQIYSSSSPQVCTERTQTALMKCK